MTNNTLASKEKQRRSDPWAEKNKKNYSIVLDVTGIKQGFQIEKILSDNGLSLISQDKTFFYTETKAIESAEFTKTVRNIQESGIQFVSIGRA